MRKIETEIPWESIALVEPPERLDEGISGLIAAARIQRAFARRGVPGWTFALACSICLVLGFMSHRLMTQMPPGKGEPAVVIEISPEDLPPNFFVIENPGGASFFEKQLHDVKIEIPKGHGEASL